MTSVVNKTHWGDFFGWLGLYLFITGLATFILYAWLSGNIGRAAGLESTILLAKAISLIALVVIGGAEITRARDCPNALKILTGCVMLYAGVIALLLGVKVVVSEMVYSPAGIPRWFAFRPTYNAMGDYGDYLAVSPLVIYAIMNGVTAWYAHRKAMENLKTEALAYFTVADIPCIIPILAVFSLVSGVSGSFAHPDGEARVFVSGAMAMFILTSNILTLVVRYVVHPSFNLDEVCASQRKAPLSGNGPPDTGGVATKEAAGAVLSNHAHRGVAE